MSAILLLVSYNKKTRDHWADKISTFYAVLSVKHEHKA